MSTQSDSYERRRFTQEEFDIMLAEGMVSPDEEAILRDGFVLVPLAPSGRLKPHPDPGPVGDATDPADLVIAEPMPQTRMTREVIMSTSIQETQEARVRRKFTVDEYYRMAEVGILSPDERTELLEGEIILMAAIGSKHAFCVDFFNDTFTIPVVKERALVRIQNPVFFNDGTEVQPDIALVRRTSYADAHPRPDDVLLLVEVSDTTIGTDRREKLLLYARFGIQEAWLADVNAKAVDIHTEPRNGRYTNVRRVGMDGILSPTAFPDVEIAVRDVFRW